ncbi:MAG: efflux RND transporter periplasmic adaptor subunit [Deltaproteobacteria bacterium]|nr:efflux RND transporter periplasmic adaptor subunit [Deltaproteobacteria bacterium]
MNTQATLEGTMTNSYGFLRWMLALSLLTGCPTQPQPDEHHHEAAHDGHGDHGNDDDHDDHGSQEPGGTVQISKIGIERSGIRTEPVRAERLVGGIDAPAEVQLNPNRTAHVAPMVPGQIDEVRVSLGDSVEANQVLATMRSVALGEARSSVANARAAVEVARANFVRQEELKREGIGSQRAYLEAQGVLRGAESDLAASNERLHVYGGRKGSGSTTTIRSPLEGTIIERHATTGEVVSDGSSLFMVSDLSRVWVVGRVYEQDVAAARIGAPAVISLQAYPGKVWEGEVSYVSHTLDPHTRTLDVRVELDNPDGTLRPGLFGRIALSPDADSAAQVAVIPQSAVQRIDGQTMVFVATDKPGVFRPTFVTLGARARGKVEVRDGLAEGDQVVVSGAFTLKSELLAGQISEGEHKH